MKKPISLLFSLLSSVMAQMPPQPLPELEHLEGQNYLFSWEGVPGRVYFIQTSSSLSANGFDWEFAPDIRVGTGSEIEMGFQANAENFEFFRLAYTDYSGELSADLADFDNDGYTNLEEALANTDPFDTQSFPGNGGGTNGGGSSGGANANGTVWNHPWEYKLTYKVENYEHDDLVNPHNDVVPYGYDREAGYKTELIFEDIIGENVISFLQFETNLHYDSDDPDSSEWTFMGVVELSAQTPTWSHDREPQGTVPSGMLLPFETQVRRPSEGKWFGTQELKIAKWKNAWIGENFRNDFIETFSKEEIDRFRIRINTQELPDEFRKIFITTSGGADEDYNDDSTEISLELDINPYGPSQGFVSKPIIIVSDKIDNIFNNNNLLDDQTHIASLGSDVNFRIESSNGDLLAKRPIKRKKSVFVNVKLLYHGSIVPMGFVEKVNRQMDIAKEIFAPAGLEVQYGFSIVDVDQAISYPPINLFGVVNLNDGFTMNNGVTDGNLHYEGKMVLQNFATPNDTDDVVCLIVPGDILWGKGGFDNNVAWGFAIPDNEELARFIPSEFNYWDDEISDLFRGTLIVSLSSGNDAILAHELGHVLTLFHPGELGANESSEAPSIVRNFMINPGNYFNSYQNDLKRLVPFQETRILASQFVSDPQN